MEASGVAQQAEHLGIAEVEADVAERAAVHGPAWRGRARGGAPGGAGGAGFDGGAAEARSRAAIAANRKPRKSRRVTAGAGAGGGRRRRGGVVAAGDGHVFGERRRRQPQHAGPGQVGQPRPPARDARRGVLGLAVEHGQERRPDRGTAWRARSASRARAGAAAPARGTRAPIPRAGRRWRGPARPAARPRRATMVGHDALAVTSGRPSAGWKAKGKVRQASGFALAPSSSWMRQRLASVRNPQAPSARGRIRKWPPGAGRNGSAPGASRVHVPARRRRWPDSARPPAR